MYFVQYASGMNMKSQQMHRRNIFHAKYASAVHKRKRAITTHNHRRGHDVSTNEVHQGDSSN